MPQQFHGPYKFLPGEVVCVEHGDVIRAEGDRLFFKCPCAHRYVSVGEEHGPSVDEEGVLTLEGSCGYKARPDLGRPKNWCHFSVSGGVPTMHSDAGCPGSVMPKDWHPLDDN